MQSFVEETSSLTERHRCDCYRKLEAFGIPLYISEENDLYTENQVIHYEPAFELPSRLTVEDVFYYPKVEECELSLVFEQMAVIIPALSDFVQNVLSFWILDMFIEGLWTAQNSKMNHKHQNATLLWIAYFFNYIMEKKPTRRELFYHLKILLFGTDQWGEDGRETDENSVGNVIHEESGSSDASATPEKIWYLPLPPDLSKKYTDGEFSSNAGEDDTERDIKTYSSSSESRGEVEENKEDTVTNIKNMKIILEILYRIFARLWVFLEIRGVFHSMPTVEQVDLPFKLNVPKTLFKLEPVVPAKAERSGKRLSVPEKSSEEIETEKQLHKNDYILPLQVSEESKAYIKQITGQPTSDRSALNRNKEDRTKK